MRQCSILVVCQYPDDIHLRDTFPSPVHELQERITAVVLSVAKKYNITLRAFGQVAFEGKSDPGELVLAEAWDHHLEPAPMTPTVNSEPWNLLSGTIQASLKSSPQYKGRGLVVVPNLALGRFY